MRGVTGDADCSLGKLWASVYEVGVERQNTTIQTDQERGRTRQSNSRHKSSFIQVGRASEKESENLGFTGGHKKRNPGMTQSGGFAIVVTQRQRNRGKATNKGISNIT